MAETESVKTPGVLASSGTPVAGKPNFPWMPQQQSAEGEGDAAGTAAAASNGAAASAAAGQQGAGDGEAAAAAAAASAAAGQSGNEPKFDFDQLSTYLKSQGIEGFETLDGLKDLVKKATTPAPAEPTPEQKAANEAALDKKMLELWLQGNGKVEDYVAFKSLVTSDVKELSVNEVKRELKKAGFDDNDIADIIKNRYYLDNPDEWQKEVGEEDADFEKKKAAYKKKATYGSQTLESRGMQIRTKAESILNGLRDQIKEQELLAQKETELSSKVDEFVSGFNRKINLELGETATKQKIDPIPYEVPEAVVTKVAAILKDSKQREQFLFNPDNSLNLTNLGNLMIAAEYGALAAREAYLQGGNRQVEVVRKVFGGKVPSELGVGGGTATDQSGKQKGKIVSAGQPEVVARKSS